VLDSDTPSPSEYEAWEKLMEAKEASALSKAELEALRAHETRYKNIDEISPPRNGLCLSSDPAFSLQFGEQGTPAGVIDTVWSSTFSLTRKRGGEAPQPVSEVSELLIEDWRKLVVKFGEQRAHDIYEPPLSPDYTYTFTYEVEFTFADPSLNTRYCGSSMCKASGTRTIFGALCPLRSNDGILEYWSRPHE
jgi:hypothetical protein